MGADRITTAADLGAMTPAERHADFESRVVTDLGELPPAEVDEIRDYHVTRLTQAGILRAS